MYKTKLQELCQGKSWSLPEYKTSKEGPDHSPAFRASVSINGLLFPTPALSRSAKQAQNDAAKLAIDHFTSAPQSRPIGDASSRPSSDSSSAHTTAANIGSLSPSIQPLKITGTGFGYEDREKIKDLEHSFKNQLQIYAQRKNLGLPVYSHEHEGPPHAIRFKSKVRIDGQTYESLESFCTVKDADHAAAGVALMSLSPDGIKEDDCQMYKNILQELARKEGYSLPIYNSEMAGEAHLPIFISSVEIEGKVFKGQAAKSKKQAELSAAKVAYISLKESKLSRSPELFSPNHQEKESHGFSSSSLQSVSMNMDPMIIPDGGEVFRMRSLPEPQPQPHFAAIGSPIPPINKSRSLPEPQPQPHFAAVGSPILPINESWKRGSYSPVKFISLSPQAPSPSGTSSPQDNGPGPFTPSNTRSWSTDNRELTSMLTTSERKVVTVYTQTPSVTIPVEATDSQPSEEKASTSTSMTTMTTAGRKLVRVYPRTPNMSIPAVATVLPCSDAKFVAVHFVNDPSLTN